MSPRIVGLLAPMPSEMKPLARTLQLTRNGDDPFSHGRSGAIDLVAARTGIGMQRARDATRRLLDGAKPDHVMVVGIAGGMGVTKVGDVFVPEVVVDRAAGKAYRSAPFGGRQPHGRIVSHDDFDMGSDVTQALVDDGFDAVDMETAAVAGVCEEHGCPWSAVRVISDLVGVTPGDVIGLANPDGSPNITASLRYLVTKPQRIPQLVRLARDANMATNRAATTAAELLRASDAG
jgi:adenosylhomocysteine nucleosidase